MQLARETGSVVKPRYKTCPEWSQGNWVISWEPSLQGLPPRNRRRLVVGEFL